MEVENSDQDFNFTVREFLEIQMGPQRISMIVVLPITIVYLTIFITGIIGNFVVCLVIIRNSNFHTPTNYYLFSLAISDILILLFGLPNDLKVYWQQYPWVFGEVVCKLRAYMAETTSYASVLTIVAFTVERYVAICHPLFMQTVSTLPRAVKLIISVWIVSCLCAIPFASYTQINYLKFPNGSNHLIQESAFCALPNENLRMNRILFQCSLFVFFLLPLTIIVILYAKIHIKLRNSRFAKVTYNESSRYSSGNASLEGKKSHVRRSISKMLVAVVIAFFVCWAPFHAQRLMAVYVDPNSWTLNLRSVNEVLYYTGGCLYYFSATINPILYSLMSVKYREAFKDTLCNGQKNKNGDQYSHYRCGRNQSEHSFSLTEREISVRKPFCPPDQSKPSFRPCHYLSVNDDMSLVASPNLLSPSTCRHVNTNAHNAVQYIMPKQIDAPNERDFLVKNETSVLECPDSVEDIIDGTNLASDLDDSTQESKWIPAKNTTNSRRSLNSLFSLNKMKRTKKDTQESYV